MRRDLDAAVARLDDYVRGHDEGEDEAAFEEELFARALHDDAPELRLRDELQTTFREMNRRGSLDIWITARDFERLRASGVRTHLFELDLARPAFKPEIPEGTDLLVTRVAVDLTGIRRLEAEVRAIDGTLLKTMPDITFDPADGAVFAVCEAELARAAASSQTRTRVFAVDDDGRRLIAELT